MKDSTRRKALESTARVALGCYLGAALGACGGQSVSDRAAEGDGQPAPEAPDPAASATPATTATTPAPVPTATGAAPTATTPAPAPSPTTPPPPDPPAPPPTPTLACLEPINLVGLELVPPFAAEQQACCESYVEGLVSAGMGPATTGTVDPSLLNCCRALAYSTLWQLTVTHETCCAPGLLSMLDRNQPYCSPWGPPVPPALVAA